jgi:hypothetical protein
VRRGAKGEMGGKEGDGWLSRGMGGYEGDEWLSREMSG